jgi:hypothetical protein
MGMLKSQEAVHGALAVDDIASHPGLHGAIRLQAQLLLQAYDGNPRLASVFGTQHRWLMAQAALAVCFRTAAAVRGRGVTSASILDFITRHEVASRNTADAFLKEMIQYRWARLVPEAADRRTRPLVPTEATLDALHGWVGIHLGTLDRLDGGGRLETYLAMPEALARLQPRIADGLLSSAKVRAPERTFSLFTWLNNGGLVMDWLIAGIEQPANGATWGEQIATGVESTVMLAQRLKLSRTHLSRKLRAAEALGSIGWQGQRGHSAMWVSPGFYREYAMAQAVKLAIIDAAFSSLAPNVEGQVLRSAERMAGYAYSASGPTL